MVFGLEVSVRFTNPTDLTNRAYYYYVKVWSILKKKKKIQSFNRYNQFNLNSY